MTAAVAEERVRRLPSWVRRVLAEMVRGRHVILHGNVHDEALWRAETVPVGQVLDDLLRDMGFQLIGRYDQLDGLEVRRAGDGGDGSREFTALLDASPARAATAGSPGQPPGDGAPGPGRAGGGAPAGGRGGQAASAWGEMSDALAASAAEPVRYTQPRDAVGAIRRALAQPHTPIAFLLDFSDLLLTDPSRNDRNDRDLLVAVKKAMMESAMAPGCAARNQLVLVTANLAAVPAWLHRDEPFVEPVQVPLPSLDERKEYLEGRVGDFYGSERGQDYSDPVRVLANLTEGMTLTEVGGLSRASALERLPLTSARELMNRAVFGEPKDPWAHLAAGLPTAASTLNGQVRGQPAAVEAVTRALARATLGIDFIADPFSLEARPKGVFFFAGPTGVGKTELCRALSTLIFDDPEAMIRFDMSTFMEPHAAERLTGAPPGYVGHERGGELTNQVSARPFSLLLFDEIEKAHKSIFDKFLQILEDGRFTDGLGRTTYFSQTLIIFTSNQGADPLYRMITEGGRDQPLPDRDRVAAHFTKAVKDYFTDTLGRPELLGRIGNGVLAFDIARPEHVDQVALKFLGQLAASAARKGITLELEQESILPAVRQEMSDPDNLALGYRGVRIILEWMVRDPIIEAAWSGGPGRSYAAAVPAGERVARVRAQGRRRADGQESAMGGADARSAR